MYGKVSTKVKLAVKEYIQENVRLLYEGVDDAFFDAKEKRWLISREDVRLTDSAYQNRDARLAQRGQFFLEKVWQDGMETAHGVNNASDPQLAA